MPTSRPGRGLPILVVFVTFGCFALLMNRESFLSKDFPVFLVPEAKKIYVGVAGDAVESGVYQLNDGLSLCGVINLTGPELSERALPSSLCEETLTTGTLIHLQKKSRRIELVERTWLSAGQRMALSIPLHPDHMSRADWVALPGIGETMAERIDRDRQNNGDFGLFSHLVRVKGVGLKSLERWERFFE